MAETFEARREPQPGDVGDTAARVLGDEVQHLDLGLGDRELVVGPVHEPTQCGKEVVDGGGDLGHVDLGEDLRGAVAADLVVECVPHEIGVLDGA